MSNIIKFPINKTRPSHDGDRRLKFNIRAVLTSVECKLWLDGKIPDKEFIYVCFKMLPGNVTPPSYDEFKLLGDDIMEVMKSKEFKLLRRICQKIPSEKCQPKTWTWEVTRTEG